MSFTCLLVYGIQVLTIIFALGSNHTDEIMVDDDDLEMETAHWKKCRIYSIVICVVAIILDAFPLFAMGDGPAMFFGSKPYEGGLMVLIMIISIITIWIMSVAAVFSVVSPEEQIDRAKALEEQRLEILCEKEQKDNNYKSLYGADYIELAEFCVVSPSQKKIWLRNKEFRFEDIIRVEYASEDSNTQIQYETTKTKTGSMLGRAAIGGLVAGPVGAVIGGATAKKETDVTVLPVEKNYSLIVTVADISNPVINLRFWGNKSAAEKCKATIEAIIFQSKGK